MTAMELVKYIAKKKKRSMAWLSRANGESQNQVYARMTAGDVKFEVWKRYLKSLGCEIVVRDLYSPDEWRI